MAIKPNANYTTSKQEFLNSVINKIGRQTYSNQVYVNPLKRFKGDFIENANHIEEIYVERAKDTGYDKDGGGVLDRTKPMVYTQYHTEEVDHGYKQTIHDKEMRKGFTSQGALSSMADNILQSLHNGATYDEYYDIINVLKELVINTSAAGAKISVDKVIDETTGKNFCKTIKKVIPKMGKWNTIYSSKENFAPINKLVLFIDSDVDVDVKAEYLAGVFNMSLTELNDTTKIVVPDMISEVGAMAILLDERCLKIHPTFYNVDNIRNTRGKFTNYDLVTSTLVSYTDWFQHAIFIPKA